LDEFDNEEDEGSLAANEEKAASSDDDWIPGQEVPINFNEILEILTQNLDSQFGKLCPRNMLADILTTD
jgi:vacuole morphology and inheritance protein 14